MIDGLMYVLAKDFNESNLSVGSIIEKDEKMQIRNLIYDYGNVKKNLYVSAQIKEGDSLLVLNDGILKIIFKKDSLFSNIHNKIHRFVSRLEGFDQIYLPEYKKITLSRNGVVRCNFVVLGTQKNEYHTQNFKNKTVTEFLDFLGDPKKIRNYNCGRVIFRIELIRINGTWHFSFKPIIVELKHVLSHAKSKILENTTIVKRTIQMNIVI